MDSKRFMTAEEAEERALIARRGKGIGPVGPKFLQGAQLALEMLTEVETFDSNQADLDRQFRDGPQVNFVLPHLERLRMRADPEIDAGFAAALSDFIANAYGYNGFDHLERLLEDAAERQA